MKTNLLKLFLATSLISILMTSYALEGEIIVKNKTPYNITFRVSNYNDVDITWHNPVVPPGAEHFKVASYSGNADVNMLMVDAQVGSNDPKQRNALTTPVLTVKETRDRTGYRTIYFFKPEFLIIDGEKYQVTMGFEPFERPTESIEFIPGWGGLPLTDNLNNSLPRIITKTKTK